MARFITDSLQIHSFLSKTLCPKYYHQHCLSRSSSHADNLLRCNLDEEVEVDIEMLPPEPEHAAPLLGGEVGRLDPVEDSRHRPPCPHVVTVSAHK